MGFSFPRSSSPGMAPSEPEVRALLSEVASCLGVSLRSKKLSSQVACALGLLGPDWLSAALAPLLVTYPKRRIYLKLVLNDLEPGFIPEGEPQLKSTAASNWIELLPASVKAKQPLDPDNLGDNLAGKPEESSRICRYLSLPAPSVIAGQGHYTYIKARTWWRRLIGEGYLQAIRFSPLLLDTLRQWRLERSATRTRDDLLNQAFKLKHLPQTDTVSKKDDGAVAAGLSSTSPVIWVAMHFLEHGGAEAWAIEQIRVAKASGFKVILTTDHLGAQSRFTQVAPLVDQVLLAGQTLGEKDWVSFAINLVRTYGISWLHIHHSDLAYRVLPVLKQHFPFLQVEDSTHILEYQGGGYVAQSIAASAWIDTQHVISPELQRFYKQCGNQQPCYYPLTSASQMPLTPEAHTNKSPDAISSASSNAGSRLSAPSSSKLKSQGERPLTVGFLGRFAIQKRPYLFLEVARQLHHTHPQNYRFLMQGAGELSEILAPGFKKLHRCAVPFTVLPWGDTKQFYQQCDLLLITSENEGLTLTSLEAAQHNCLVLSTDVGSQSSVIPRRCLLPVKPQALIRKAAALINQLSYQPELLGELLAEQQQLGVNLRGQLAAADFFHSHYAEALKKEDVR